MYKIGELSKIVDIPIKTLRYYDEYGILKPAKIDQFTGYRFYDDESVVECELIKMLKAVNFTLEEIKQYINKVSNSINLVEDKVNVRINNFSVEFINEVNNNIIKHKVEYPTLSHYTINIFNLKNFILKNFKVSDN